jgi:glucan 1,3-beta-glucosidase
LLEIKQAIKGGTMPIRGTNLGGWLVAERWMTGGSPAWNGVPDNVAAKGEYVTMKHLGHANGDAQFDSHRRTFITEQDFKVRIQFNPLTAPLDIRKRYFAKFQG